MSDQETISLLGQCDTSLANDLSNRTDFSSTDTIMFCYPFIRTSVKSLETPVKRVMSESISSSLTKTPTLVDPEFPCRAKWCRLPRSTLGTTEGTPYFGPRRVIRSQLYRTTDRRSKVSYTLFPIHGLYSDGVPVSCVSH